MAALFKPQTEAELRAAMASRCNLVLDPILKRTCLEVASSGPVTEPTSPIIPRWAITLTAVAGAGYVLWRILR